MKKFKREVKYLVLKQDEIGVLDGLRKVNQAQLQSILRAIKGEK